jgi:hypothetical protein
MNGVVIGCDMDDMDPNIKERTLKTVAKVSPAQRTFKESEEIEAAKARMCDGNNGGIVDYKGPLCDN